jgi:hypothetical protein
LLRKGGDALSMELQPTDNLRKSNTL